MQPAREPGMEADWSVEIGAGLPVIDADWPGFVDLRRDFHSIDSIPEAAVEAALREALVTLNGAASPVFTSKCDVWALGADEIDPDEFGCAPRDACAAGWASWIDLLVREPRRFASFEAHDAWVRRTTAHLRTDMIPCGRVDLVVRAAVAHASEGFGITLYSAGCGVDTQAARAAWERVLRAAVTATMREARASSSIG
jgi:hypothetical protein